MNLRVLGLCLFIFLAIPPIAGFMEQVMIIHMHMQMPMLVIAGMLMGPFFTSRYSGFFAKWNRDGIPGIVLFAVIALYWTLPRTMDEALTMPSIEIFKFLSLPFLAGVPLRDSWGKLTLRVKNTVFIGFTLAYLVMGLLYIYSPVQLCNNYLLIEQITLGWGFLLTAICIAVYVIYFNHRQVRL